MGCEKKKNSTIHANSFDKNESDLVYSDVIKVPNGIRIEKVVFRNLDTHLGVEKSYYAGDGLERLLPGLYVTQRGEASPPPGLLWKIEICWRSANGVSDYLPVYVTRELKIIEVQGPEDNVRKLQDWVRKELTN
jgi:hypothetical protein